MPEHGCGDGKHWTAARLGVADPRFEPWVVLAKEFQMQYGTNKTKSINSKYLQTIRK